MNNERYFSEPPHIARVGDDYFLRWRYGSYGFYFSPNYKVVDGELLFSLQGTSSTGNRKNMPDQLKIEGQKAIQAMESKGAYWLGPDGEKTRLEIRSSNPA